MWITLHDRFEQIKANQGHTRLCGQLCTAMGRTGLEVNSKARDVYGGGRGRAKEFPKKQKHA